MKKCRVIYIGAISAFIILIAPYIKVEVLTWQHGSEFASLYRQGNIIDEIEYFKVMEYSEASAKVYYVTGNRSAGILITFIQQDGKWVIEKWDAIWSKSGSADDFIWPFYR